MKSLNHASIKYWLILFFISAWLLFLRFNDPVETSFYPKCPFHAVTGLDCPGCGSSRCAHDLVHFDLGSAFMHNPLTFIAIPTLLIYAFGGIAGWWKRDRFTFLPDFVRSKVSVVVLVIVVVFSIARNL